MSIRVLVVDDSAIVRKVLTDIISNADGMHLVDTAHDPIIAVEKLKRYDVDVIILDIEMPRMDGLTFLSKLMNAKPTPVIMLSSLTKKNADISLQAFELGAFDVLAKPEDIMELHELKHDIIQSIYNAGKSNVTQKLKHVYRHNLDKTPHVHQTKRFTTSRSTTEKLIVLGSSTGGTTAIKEILEDLPADIPGMVIVQHMPLNFSQPFTDRLNSSFDQLTIKLAQDGDRIQRGFVYIAPGEQHCSIVSSGAKYYLKLRDGPKVHYHKPSVSVLFNSAANYAGKNVIGVMLTGMGDDGSKAMKTMKDNGSYNIVQDEESSIVWGMPGKAVEYGAAHKVLPLDKIAEELVRFIQKNNF